MSTLKPKALFRAVSKNGLVPSLQFDSDEDDASSVNNCNKDRGSSNPSCSPYPDKHRFQCLNVITHNSSCSSNSDDERVEADRLDSSTDSAVGGSRLSPGKKSINHSQSKVSEEYSSPMTKIRGATPPYKGVRALRLFGSPQSPKSLLKQSELSSCEMPNRICSRLDSTPNIESSEDFNRNLNRIRKIRPVSTPKLEANINPFTKRGMLMNSQTKKRRRTPAKSINNDSAFENSLDSFIDDSDDEIIDRPPFKRLQLRELNTCISRYETDFLEQEKIGTGEFGSVYKCINRLDGCEYALKKSKKPLKGTADERRALNEVYAHAVLGRHTHVVRYYSAWAENDHMLIQNEYCSGGSLADVIEKNREKGINFTEHEIKRILLHLSLGLKYIHSVGLVHLDIKPGNIFLTSNHKTCPIKFHDDGFEDEEDIPQDKTIYKIGDLGHVTSIVNPEVEEGDCRYFPAEILADNYRHLPKVDVFALGLTMFEAGGVGPLPKNGPEWHSIREGNLPYLPHYSLAFNNLLKQMVHPDPEIRPSSASLTHHETLVPYGNKTKAQLSKELNVEKKKNEFLSKKLENILHTFPQKICSKKSIRAIGGKCNRSSSVTNF